MVSIKKSAEEWFRQAEYDLETARIMFKAGRYIYTVFMSHLSLEKALKGLYTKRFNEMPHQIHSLTFFSEKLKLNLPEEMGIFLDTISTLSVPTRYPDDIQRLLKGFKKAETKKILFKTKEILEWLKKKLKE